MIPWRVLTLRALGVGVRLLSGVVVLYAAASLLLVLALMDATVRAVPSAAAAPCPAVEVVFARGRDEPPGIGQVGQAFVEALQAKSGRDVGARAKFRFASIHRRAAVPTGRPTCNNACANFARQQRARREGEKRGPTEFAPCRVCWRRRICADRCPRGRHGVCGPRRLGRALQRRWRPVRAQRQWRGRPQY
ncbi:MAG: cutinase family protein [Mycobacteriaceae bacterium]|nr:cutinase family protein [Mycobacteriaceae bacterium]